MQRCCALSHPALCCCALCCFVSLCFVRLRAVWCPRALSVALGSCAFRRCFLQFFRPCVLCAVCVLPWYVDACCCLPLCFVLCVSCVDVLCVPCPLCSTLCWVVLCWCSCVVLFVWSLLFLAPVAVVRCCLLCCFLLCCAVLLCAVLCRPVRCGAALRPLARLAGCPVVWCKLLCAPALRWCPAPWCCAPLWCASVRCCVLLSCCLVWFVACVCLLSRPIKTTAKFVKIFFRPWKIKENYTLPHRRKQAGSKTVSAWLSYLSPRDGGVVVDSVLFQVVQSWT